MRERCKQCGKEFKKIAMHWTTGSCNHPSFTQHQREIITGLLMGDGCINRGNNRNPRIMSEMISFNYLKYIDNKFGIFGQGVKNARTAEENAKKSRNSGLNKYAKAKNYSDLYWWQSMAHPELQEFADWYSSGKKVWPEDIELTPTVLKHWYCGDGHYHNSGSNNRIEIGMSNEVENTDKVDKMFENVGLPKPCNYSISERKDGGINCSASWTTEDSKILWEYMGEPLPDFEYKWPESFK